MGIGLVFLVHLYRRLRARAVDPDRIDPARGLHLLLLWGCPATLVLVLVIVNVGANQLFESEALLPALILNVLAVGALIAAAIQLWEWIEIRRRETGYVICEGSYIAAPRHIKRSMRRIYKSARTVRDGNAYRQGMLERLELDRLVYSAAERAVISSELSAGTQDLRMDARGDDQQLLDSAEQQLADIREYIEDVEIALKRTAETASRLSASIPDPVKERAEQQAAREAALASEARRRDARARVKEASVRAGAPAKVSSTEVEEHVSAVYSGYREASRISNEILAGEGPLVSNEDEGAERRSTSATAWKVARWTASKATKASSAAAKYSADQIKKRSSETR